MTRLSILEEAIRCVTKDRNATHGDPEDNFNTIAQLWHTYMLHRRSGNLNGVDVAVMMMLMKISRIITSPEHPDHWVDAAGYSACGGGIATKPNPNTCEPMMQASPIEHPKLVEYLAPTKTNRSERFAWYVTQGGEVLTGPFNDFFAARDDRDGVTKLSLVLDKQG